MEVAAVKANLATNIRERPATMLSATLDEPPAAARQLVGEEDTMKKMIQLQAPPFIKLQLHIMCLYKCN